MIISTAGHVNHGKTSLLKALTGIDCDRLPEEKRRGLTIEPEFIPAQFLGDDVFFIDVPGHERFVRAMMGANVGVNAALYAIDATEGIMPQTKEHTFILGLLGVARVVVALTKSDKCDASLIALRVDEVRRFFETRSVADIYIVAASIYDEKSICELKSILAGLPFTERISGDKPFRLYADRSFSVKGAGTVVTGSVTRGEVCVGDMLYVYPAGVTVRVKRIEKGGINCEKVHNGRAALNLVGVATDDVARGSVLYREGDYALFRRFTAHVVMRGDRQLKNNGIYNMFIGASKLRARYLEKSSVFVLESLFPLDAGDVFFIRGGSPETTIAGGTVLSVCTESQRKAKIKKTERREVITADTENFLNMLKTAGGYSAAGNLAASCGMGIDEFNAAVKRLVATENIVTLENYIMTKKLFDEFIAMVQSIIAREGFADLASFKQISKLPRNIAAAILDKGDRLMLWRNMGNKRV